MGGDETHFKIPKMLPPKWVDTPEASIPAFLKAGLAGRHKADEAINIEESTRGAAKTVSFQRLEKSIYRDLMKDEGYFSAIDALKRAGVAEIVPFLKSNGVVPTAFFMNWRFKSELEGYAQLRQAKGKSLTVYHILKYSYYAIFIVMIFFIISVFKNCDQDKSQYDILKEWHDSNLEHRLKQ